MPIVDFREYMRDKDKTIGGPKPTIGVYSLGLKSNKGNAKQFAQFEFDVTKFRDPTGQKQFKGKSGLDKEVQAWVREDARVESVVKDCLLLADDLVTVRVKTEGSKTESTAASGWLSFAFRDHHGLWAAPAIAEIVARALSEKGYVVVIMHREFK